MRFSLPLHGALYDTLVFLVLDAGVALFHEVLRALLALLVQDSAEAGPLVV